MASLSHQATGDSASALAAYEPLAPFYDLFTADFPHEPWVGHLLDLAADLGASSGRLLDVACGTGKSFAPAVVRGFAVSACDISPAMVERARTRLPSAPERVTVADMRALPASGRFNVVTCLDDAVNYLLEPEALDAAVVSLAGTLAPGGLLLFDVNTLRTYRTTFASAFVLEREDTLMCWWGRTPCDVPPGAVCRASIEVVAPVAAGLWSRVTSRHAQRHRPLAEVVAACRRAGLRVERVAGQVAGGIDGAADEQRHPKALVVARKP